jgi:16S rRNA (adenine1518-N6/adenine1519-N6)-dimethyltransferase
MSRRRALGQHFLVDARAIARIVAALEPRATDAVVEIGPGRGALTAALVAAVGRIAAIEVDPSLAADLRARYDPARLVLIESDVLRVPLDDVAAALGLPPGSGALKIAGNLPYAISKPVVQKILRERGRVERAVLMFQREVAERLTAAPGSRAYGPLGVLAGRLFAIETLLDLPPGAFRPAPRVHSRVTVWRPRRERPLAAQDEARLRTCLAACFARRRRTLRNNLCRALGTDTAASALLRAASLDGEKRAEQLDLPAFERLAALWP